MGHEITYLVKRKSTCPFATVLELDPKKPLSEQIPDEVDLVHLHDDIEEELPKPSILTYHQNSKESKVFPKNTVFLSKNQARRHGGSVFVYNGIDFNDYGEPNLRNRRMYFHFLGDAGLRVKNVRGAIELTKKADVRLHVIGGTRVQIKSRRFTLNPHVRFHGMVGGDGKNVLLNGSKGLVYPVLWHEPFGLAIVESLYFGCPVFGTPFGSLPELLGSRDNLKGQLAGGTGRVDAVYSDFGCLSVKKSELQTAIQNADSFGNKRCHEYVCDLYSSRRMATDYLTIYERILNGESLHEQAPEYECSGEEEKLKLEN
ncbi:MAG: glycosyltransferase [Saprospiraceae bacterium]